MQARRVDSVEGGSFICWEVRFSAEGLTRALIRREPLGGSGCKPPPPPPQGNFANLGSLKCYFLHFDISEVGCIFLQYKLFGK